MTYELDSTHLSALESHTARFVKKFGLLQQAEQIYSTHDLRYFITAHQHPNLKALTQQLLQSLCSGRGFVLLKNVAVDKHLDIALFILGAYLGRPLYNNRDRRHVWPIIEEQIESTKNLTGNVRYGNTGQALKFHTDTGTIAALLCETSAMSGGENDLISTVSVHNMIYDTNIRLLQELYQPFYIDRRGEELDGMLPYSELPVFAYTNTVFQTFWASSYNYDAYKKYAVLPKLTSSQLEAYDCLKETMLAVASQQKYTIKLERGDLLLVNNNLIFHNRRSFVSDKKRPRKLHRLWVELKEYPSLPHMFGYN